MFIVDRPKVIIATSQVNHVVLRSYIVSVPKLATGRKNREISLWITIPDYVSHLFSDMTSLQVKAAIKTTGRQLSRQSLS